MESSANEKKSSLVYMKNTEKTSSSEVIKGMSYTKTLFWSEKKGKKREHRRKKKNRKGEQKDHLVLLNPYSSFISHVRF